MNTVNSSTAAAKARDVYVSLVAHGWEKTLTTFKPRILQQNDVKSMSVGDVIRELSASGNFRGSTFAVHCIALWKIAGHIAGIPANKSRLAPNSQATKQWRHQVDEVPVDALTNDRD